LALIFVIAFEVPRWYITLQLSISFLFYFMTRLLIPNYGSYFIAVSTP